MPLYDCECLFGHRFEKSMKMDARHHLLICPECGESAHTIVSPVRSKLDGTDPSWPGAYMKWERDHTNKRKK